MASLDEDTGKFAPEPAARLREMQLAVSADGRYVPLRLDRSLDGLPITAVIEGDSRARLAAPTRSLVAEAIGSGGRLAAGQRLAGVA